ncbi:MAG TPA: glycosyltransferase family 39 protein [Oscillatoriaceae cyanobacterium M33_DOE_052]|uniref:Glycosyltransferase RgtA/B/C/D-like domain-containing protein n=1 Tax=Planktothricoides sp. SpSt-374 TaxID=2282167 RepID=A0A7C3VFQ8_9CYAN|nr:glycosyltransferase family 39 protein [Oscillatoriaceae cyanobacterium M33_DOE_052]
MKKHYLFLAGIIALAAVLRWVGLEGKPLWLDEIMTAVFSLGRSYNDMPLNRVFPLRDLSQIFSLNSATSCGEIAGLVASQSTHPPLFFCLMHAWLKARGVATLGDLAGGMRAIASIGGVATCAAIYYLGKAAFSPRIGLIAAALMAVSPFAVYLSQEARHYTLPLLLISLALTVMVIIQKNLENRQSVPLHFWLIWAIINAVGLWTHYFFLLALVAQIGALTFGQLWRRQFSPTLLFCILPFLLFIPWYPVLIEHFNRQETDWFVPFEPSWTDGFAPIFQTITGWVLMVVAFPVENQPLWVAVPAAIVMLGFVVWLVRELISNGDFYWITANPSWSSKIILIFTLIVLGELFIIVYILGKDITSAVRYHFTYYPGVCVLLAAGLAGKNLENKRTLGVVLAVGLLSSMFVVSDLAFQKPYQPAIVAKNMNIEPDLPLMVAVGYDTFQDVALGLSFALEVEKLRPSQEITPTYWGFWDRHDGYHLVWENLAKLPELPTRDKLNLWVVAPGLRRRDYPPQLLLSQGLNCMIDENESYRIGIPYQLYRCGSS